MTQNLSFAVFLEAYKTFPPFSFYLCLLKNLWTNCIRFSLNSSSFARKAELELRFYQLFPEEEDLALLPQGGLRLGPRERFALLVFCDYTFTLCVIYSVVCDSLRPHGLWSTRLLCPWNSPGKNTGMGSHSLLQGIFLTQGSNLGLLHCRQIL